MLLAPWAREGVRVGQGRGETQWTASIGLLGRKTAEEHALEAGRPGAPRRRSECS